MKRLLLGLAVIGSLGASGGKDAKELLFGEIPISYLPGQDRLRPLPSCDGSWNRPVDRISVDVFGPDVYFHQIYVKGADGEERTIDVKETVRQSYPPKFFSLGTPICVVRLDFVPDPTVPRPPASRQATVRVWGQVPQPTPEP